MGDTSNNTLLDIDDFNDSLSLPDFNENKAKELPSFSFNEDSSKNLDDDLRDIPLPPPELKAKNTFSLIKDIEEDFLQNEVSEKDMEDAKDTLESLSVNPLFVNIEHYGALIQTIRSTRMNMKAVVSSHARLEALSLLTLEETEKLAKAFENIQRKIITLDNRIFEKISEED